MSEVYDHMDPKDPEFKSRYCLKERHERCRACSIHEPSHEQRVATGVAVIYSWSCTCECHYQTV